MLDQETKRRIDNARDILVGKVPDPKSQVEQITIALIYKFMDDIDKSSEELGGEAQFFTEGFKQYSWSKLMDSRLSGQERLNLYTEGISKLGTHKNLPQLFRDIFKGAFLPYRDPNVLHIFLKEINGFTYDHSENLGNAFEYLLSIMGSQGDAGQFRTSRHIIDFIVDVVDPKKDETVLDPSCGTAGFLISAYKHILRRHDGKNDPENKEQPLTPDERERLMEHFVGYDISPDMVRLSLVNMYLHGFQSPKIFEYDTLGSEDRWDERYDVILANPPFMSPKGGVRPHRRFSIQANRTEVLFVDYMAEHLTSEGRAGIIVPEGIIFQNGIAYKNLRKMLLEEGGLYAVASLPAGVFNPYSGVKTSILFLDKKLGKLTKEILFIKIENDGFDLGAQRRKVSGDDLPNVVEALRKYKKSILEGSAKFSMTEFGVKASLVPRDLILHSKDVSLTAYSYEEKDSISGVWPQVRIGDISSVVSGGGFPHEYQGKTEQEIPFLKVSDMNIHGNEKYIRTWNHSVSRDDLVSLKVKTAPSGTIIFPKIGAAIATNKKRILTRESAFDNNVMGLIPSDGILPEFLYSLLTKINLSDWSSDSALPSIRKTVVEDHLISLPPLDVQKQITEEIEVKQHAIDSAKELIRSLERERRYLGRSIEKIEGVERVALGTVCEMQYGFTDTAKDSGEARFIRITDIDETGHVRSGNQKYIDLSDETKNYLLEQGDLLVARTGATYGKTAIFDEAYPAVFASYLIRLRFDQSKVLPGFYWVFAQSDEYWDQAKLLVTGGGQPQFNANVIQKIKVPMIPIEDQQRLIDEIQAEETVMSANRNIVDIYQAKIDNLINNI